jgi:hypothetical protein
MTDKRPQIAQDGYKPITEGYQPRQRGFQPSTGGAAPPKMPPAPPKGGSSAMRPAGPNGAQGTAPKK